MSHRREVARRSDRGDRGAGLIGLTAGVLVVVAFLLFAVQLLMSLYTASVVTSAGQDAVRLAASREVDHDDPASVVAARQRAEVRVRRMLGRFGERVTLDWAGSTDDMVALRLQADAPRFLLPGLPAELGFDRVDRTVRARVERWQ